jgi:hypothetical protein
MACSCALIIAYNWTPHILKKWFESCRNSGGGLELGISKLGDCPDCVTPFQTVHD